MSRGLEHPEIQEILADLRGLLDAFDDTRPDQMTTFFYVHAFNEFSVCVRALLDAIDRT